MLDQKSLDYLKQLSGMMQNQSKANATPTPAGSPAAQFRSQYPNGLIGAVMNRMQPQGDPFPTPVGSPFPTPLNGNPFPKPLVPMPQGRPAMAPQQAQAQPEPFGFVPPPSIPL